MMGWKTEALTQLLGRSFAAYANMFEVLKNGIWEESTSVIEHKVLSTTSLSRFNMNDMIDNNT